jgi:molybdopterin synthase sulfur carrier subunit
MNPVTNPATNPATNSATNPATVDVELPFHLRSLAGILTHTVALEMEGEVTQATVLNTLEDRYPALRGTIRDQVTHQRRPFLRFFACQQDLTHTPPDQPLPVAVASGKEVFIILGAIAGG